MGTCFGRCLHRSNSGVHQYPNNTHSTLTHDGSLDSYDMDDQMLPEDNQPKITSRKPCLELTDELWSPFADTNYKRLNNSCSSQTPISHENSVDNISLQCLDARSLLIRGAARDISSSTPPSSLDLEWEHEVLAQPAPWQLLPEGDDLLESSTQTSQTSTPNIEPKKSHRTDQATTNLSVVSSGWSRISTPDSLEWDHVEASPLAGSISELGVSELDAETEQLLSEIERLTSTALRETGQELLDR